MTAATFKGWDSERETEMVVTVAISPPSDQRYKVSVHL